MRKVFYWFVCVVLLLSLSLIASCSSGTTQSTSSPISTSVTQTSVSQVTLRLTLVQPPMDDIAKEMFELAKRFNARTGGKYIIEVYPAEQLAKYPETLDAVRTGAVEMANVGWGGFMNNLPILGAAEIPFLYESPEANAKVAAALPGLYDAQFQSSYNQKALACHFVGGIEVPSNKPIKKLEDWKGITIAGSTYYGPELAKIFGAAPVFVPWTDFYGSMEKGVVDTVLDSPAFTVIGKLYEVIKYDTVFYGLGSSHGITINLNVWNKMPKDIQNILVEETNKSTDKISSFYIGFYKDCINKLSESGVEVYFVPKAERDRWKSAASKYIGEQEVIMGEVGQKIKSIAEKANKEFPYNH
jgi:TRAP-type transport system periplasmic protein